MKVIQTLVLLLLFVGGSHAQTRNIDWPKYWDAVDSALRKTEGAYPYIETTVIAEFENGKPTVTTTYVSEHESHQRFRTKAVIVFDKRETYRHQIALSYVDYYCSEDGIEWKVSRSGCFDLIIALPGAETTNLSVSEAKMDGKEVKVFRRSQTLKVFHGPEINRFRDTVITVDSGGFLLTMETAEGTIVPKTIMRTSKQSWVTQAKIEPVVAPKQIVDKK
jgi:hypothetical protein